RHCSGLPSVEITRTEQMLRQRIDELELERSRSLADPVSEDASGKQLLTQLEKDRQLLAEAWERLERERIEAIAAGSVARPAVPAHHPHPAEGLAMHGSPAVPRTEKVPHHARGSFTSPGTPQRAGRLPP